jgi:hypothetical protein
MSETQDSLFADLEASAPVVQSEPEPVLTTREISRYINYYKKHVRSHSVAETAGVIRNIQRILAGKPGLEPISPQDIADAIKNYQNDKFIQNLPPARRKHVRSFFTYENILAWRKPIAQCAKPGRRTDGSLNTLQNVEQHFRPVTVTPPVAIEPIEDEHEEVEF